MESNKILCCVFNYGRSLNAIKWADSLRDEFAVSILDSYVLDHPEEQDALTTYDGNVLFFHNIFLGGLTIEAFKLCIGGAFDFLLIINSDVEIDEKNLQNLKWRLHNMPQNIGIYEVSTTPDSCVMGIVGEIEYTKRYFSKSTEEFKENGLAEGWLYGINANCIKQILPFLSQEKNKHGWGIGGDLSVISKYKGYKNVIDPKVFVFHPKGTGYNIYEAKQEWFYLDKLSEKIGIHESFITIGYCAKQHNQAYKEYLQSWFSNAIPVIEKICNTDNKAEVLQAYNEIIEESETDGIILIPEETWIDAGEVLYTSLFQELFFKYKDFGIIGCAAKYITNNDIIVRKNEPVFCFKESDENMSPSILYNGGQGEMFAQEVFEDAILDGRLLAIRKDRIKHLFNTQELNLPYDTEFCLSNYLDGVKIGVTKMLVPTYFIKNKFDQTEYNSLLKKYGDKLPIKI